MGLTDNLPEKNEEYGTKQYWDQRYSQEATDATFDWFKKYEDVADLIRDAIPDKHARILMLGCGNSTLSEDMYDDGYKNIVNIDYSDVVIERMKSRHSVRPEMEWHEMDIRDLKFENNSFDIAIDKGTMDAMMTAKGDVWDPPQQVIDDCTKEVDEVIRVLRKGGQFLYLTFGQPHFRKRFLEREGTTLEIKRIGEAFHYYFYILRA
ncbi:S-adenosyl-L-methionine-dependent methyltransferase [Stereum hirsutum FP-91666 SS1]|uniref:S-adenosyl-L-methionine-dependent methyltransferase n=1 Tax=Stereum hirsutum (strain FP-91666) TaxID=721885 RepID=UPI000444A740|nr:S-adenosyl-L-methionine-dependent methyltransferase [Stereum hirsutum FP-91666 SS1]EIM86845.1 S-adenosyl-L-methionine-dependent methyltransferase [Stereum hirsutum FP-91666 SS1]